MCLKFFYPKTTSLPQLPEAAAPSANLSQIMMAPVCFIDKIIL
jgi:hypothetical protein